MITLNLVELFLRKKRKKDNVAFYLSDIRLDKKMFFLLWIVWRLTIMIILIKSELRKLNSMASKIISNTQSQLVL